nr:MAG TPA: hypothetical protein [Caudoviricetes sp.]DAM26228.1 MAG TPA: hypothetical protein [Caudoviricetes sp.]
MRWRGLSVCRAEPRRPFSFACSCGTHLLSMVLL